MIRVYTGDQMAENGQFVDNSPKNGNFLPVIGTVAVYTSGGSAPEFLLIYLLQGEQHKCLISRVWPENEA